MNNLTTRKIVLGLLMGLVLVFSVQGIADALTFGTSRSGDLQTIVNENEFTISFSVSSKSNTHITHTDDERITQPWTPDDGAPSGISTLTIGGNVYYIDSDGYVLNERGGNRVNTAGVAIDNSGYQVNADGNRVPRSYRWHRDRYFRIQTWCEREARKPVIRSRWNNDLYPCEL